MSEKVQVLVEYEIKDPVERVSMRVGLCHEVQVWHGRCYTNFVEDTPELALAAARAWVATQGTVVEPWNWIDRANDAVAAQGLGVSVADVLNEADAERALETATDVEAVMELVDALKHAQSKAEFTIRDEDCAEEEAAYDRIRNAIAALVSERDSLRETMLAFDVSATTREREAFEAGRKSYSEDILSAAPMPTNDEAFTAWKAEVACLAEVPDAQTL